MAIDDADLAVETSTDLRGKARATLDSVLITATSEIVSAYVSRNHIAQNEVPLFVVAVVGALRSSIGSSEEKVPTAAVKQMPAVPIKNSVTPDGIICLEDGKIFKSMKRHLMSKYGMTPEQYRRKWGLPATYPMVSETYSRKRSELAMEHKLGQGRPVMR